MLKTFEMVVVKQPKISAKQLCEYAEATANGRLSILKACKIKKPGIIAISRRYNEAEELICTFMAHSRGFFSVLKDYAKDLKKKSSTKIDKEKENLEACAEALEAFYQLDAKVQHQFADMLLRCTLSDRTHKFMLGNVTISIRPELMTSADSGLSECGFVKLYFGKTTALTKTMGENMATLGKYYFQHVRKKDFERENCIVIDVFAGQIYHAPKAEKRTLKNLEACCAEIADRWEKIG